MKLSYMVLNVCDMTHDMLLSGEGLSGLKIVEEDIPKPGQGEVLVRLTLRPVNPTDEHSIAGKRPLGPHEVPFTVGAEVWSLSEGSLTPTHPATAMKRGYQQ
jgi:hypothetical protein